ncbi:hypothetical protein [Neoroseomonas soli]|uniref:hypothetical protein n=1 Tax=Neoroseomonas soli TaxID=1081025 RepID=UPI001FE83966|nr:hypothetical protein [Neoroseomonas soli]
MIRINIARPGLPKHGTHLLMGEEFPREVANQAAQPRHAQPGIGEEAVVRGLHQGEMEARVQFEDLVRVGLLADPALGRERKT